MKHIFTGVGANLGARGVFGDNLTASPGQSHPEGTAETLYEVF